MLYKAVNRKLFLSDYKHFKLVSDAGGTIFGLKCLVHLERVLVNPKFQVGMDDG